MLVGVDSIYLLCNVFQNIMEQVEQKRGNQKEYVFYMSPCLLFYAIKSNMFKSLEKNCLL